MYTSDAGIETEREMVFTRFTASRTAVLAAFVRSSSSAEFV
ncbi:MAG: hypothetical protein NTZ39_06075 [Methanoregula sp.]|nr:hypothetical protein [Methanoregula sp.]